MRRNVLLGVLCSVLAACSGGDKSDGGSDAATAIGTPQGAPVSATIGSEGGSLTSADGRLGVRIPPGALTTPTRISVQAISNEAHGGVGSAYRIDAGGATLAVPASLEFAYDDEDVLGSSPEQLKLAFQREDRQWQVAGTPALDTVARTVTVETSHFSDWSPIRGMVLRPVQATVKTGESVSFEVVTCVAPPSESPVAPLVVPCSRIPTLHDMTWSVNGTAGGNSTIGTVVGAPGGSATYTAPREVPEPDEVAVSTRFRSELGTEILVAPVRIVANADYVATFEIEVTSDDTAYTATGRAELVEAGSSGSETTYELRSGSVKLNMPVQVEGLTCMYAPVEAPIEALTLVILRDSKKYYWSTGTVWEATATCETPDGVLTVGVAAGAMFTTLKSDCAGIALQSASSLDLLQGSASYTCGSGGDVPTTTGTWTFTRVQ